MDEKKAMIELYIGPMWSGKTTRLLDRAGISSSLAVYDDLNTRNSERDLRQVLKDVPSVLWNPPIYTAETENIAVVLFDEVHLYQVFKQERLFWQRFHFFRKKDVVISLAGVYLDCYNDYKPFEILTELIPFCTFVVACESLIPCAQCGKLKDVLYTRNISSLEKSGHVGNHYENVCLACVRPILGRIRDAKTGETTTQRELC